MTSLLSDERRQKLEAHLNARGGLPSRETANGSDVWTWRTEKALIDSTKAQCSPNLWIVHGKVYDLNSFLDEHPGGRTWLELTKGQDVTEAFEAHHLNMKKAQAKLKTFSVGETASDYVGRYEWNDNGFYRTLKRKVCEVFKETQPNGLPDTGPKLFSLVLSSVAIGLHFAVFALSLHYKSYLLAIGTGLTLQTFHGIGHNALHRKDNIWMYAYDFCGWKHHKHRISHALSHHLFPNTKLDLEHPEPGSFVFTSNVDRNSKWVFITGPLMMWSGPLRYIFELWFNVSQKKEPWRPEYCFNVLQLLAYMKCWGFSHGLGGFCVMHLVCGFCIETAGFGLHRSVFCWTHGDPNAKYDFGEHCLSATADHDVDISLSSSLFLYQHLNNHGIHHLFPTIDVSRIPEIMPIFRQTCKEFDIPWQDHVWLDIFGSLWKTWMKGLYHNVPMITTPPRGHVLCTNSSMRIQPILGQTFGAVITGIQVKNMTSEEWFLIKKACIHYSVVVFQDQELSPDEQVSFTLRFPHNRTCNLMEFCGPLAKDGFDAEEWRKFKLPQRPEIQLRGYMDLKDHYGVTGMLDTRKGAYEFHSDSCHEYETPPIFTSLYCVCTPGGDDTLFIDACLAYERLSPTEQEKAENLFVQYTREPRPLHESGLCADFSADISTLGKIYGSAVQAIRSTNVEISQVHPLVWTHPNTGRKAIIVAGMWMYRVVESDGTAWSPQASHEYIYHLLKPVTAQQYVHKWQANDLIVFDNRSVLHSASAATANFGDRLLHQIILCGNQIPVGPVGSGVQNPTVNPNYIANEDLYTDLPN